MNDQIKPLIDLLSGHAPWLLTVIVWIGALQTFFHFAGPLAQKWFAGRLVAIVDSPDPDDDHYLLAILDNGFYKFIAFLLQLTSLPLPTRADYNAALANKKKSANPIVGLLLIAGLSATLIGCAAIQPGADPLVVNVERAQTMAAATFDLVLATDQADRGFWRTNAPAFHNYCEWLRVRQPVTLHDGSVTNLQRALAMQVGLDKLKLDYKASKVSSNALFEAYTVFNTAAREAEAWLTLVQLPSTATNTAAALTVTNTAQINLPPNP